MSSVSHFVVSAFEQTIDLGVAGSIFSEPIPAIDVSAVAVIEVSLDTMRSVFQFQTDATDVNNLAESDIKYFVDTEAWAGLADVQPANAMLDHSESTGAISTADPNGSLYPADKMLVAHDFIRYLALRLFNTPYGVDLFQNEDELMTDIRTKCSALEDGGLVWKTVIEKLTAVNKQNAADGEDDSGKYMTNPAPDADPADAQNNICRVLMLQMLNTQIARFQDITLNNESQTGTVGVLQGLPFVEGDSISFKLTVNPAADQELATGVAEFAGRSYEIRLRIAASPSNTEPSANEPSAEIP